MNLDALDRIFRAKNRWDGFWVSLTVADELLGGVFAKGIARAAKALQENSLQDKEPATITVKAERGDPIQ